MSNPYSLDCFKIFQFICEGLPVHLQDHHTVLLNEAEASTALARSQDTTLTAYFNLIIAGWRADGKQTSENGGPLFYVDVPKWYKWEQNTRSWKPRLRMRREDQAVIGRLYSVAPKDLDRFYLRLLLLHTPNATGYVGAGALKATAEPTWRAGAEQRGLVETDEDFIFSWVRPASRKCQAASVTSSSRS